MRENPLVDSDPEMIRLEIDYYEDMRQYGKLIEKALPLTDVALYEDSISVRRRRPVWFWRMLTCVREKKRSR